MKKQPPHDLEQIMPILINAWRKFHKLSGPADMLQTREFRSVVSQIEKIKNGMDSDKTKLGHDYFQNPDLLTAYILYYWVIHYQQGLSLINELPHTPKRVLDIGSGPLPFAFAALRHGANEVIATDRNHAALQLGADICGRYGLPVQIRKWDCLTQAMPVEGKFDLIILGHCLDELFPNSNPHWLKHQHTFTKSLLERLTPEGFLLIVDDSHQASNQRLLQLRDLLVQEGVPVQAPCVWRGACPALQTANSPCYAQREFEKPYLVKEIQRAAQINLNSLKMSYIIFKSPKSAWPQLDAEPLYRVISPPADVFTGKRYYLCGTDGKKRLESHLKEHPAHSRAFEYLKRGELISIEQGLNKDHAIDILPETKVTVKAACGKSLPQVE
jgi:hypothetical protein